MLEIGINYKEYLTKLKKEELVKIITIYNKLCDIFECEKISDTKSKKDILIIRYFALRVTASRRMASATMRSNDCWRMTSQQKDSIRVSGVTRRSMQTCSSSIQSSSVISTSMVFFLFSSMSVLLCF